MPPGLSFQQNMLTIPTCLLLNLISNSKGQYPLARPKLHINKFIFDKTIV
jgi:hypothetical protein